MRLLDLQYKQAISETPRPTALIGIYVVRILDPEQDSKQRKCDKYFKIERIVRALTNAYN